MIQLKSTPILYLRNFSNDYLLAEKMMYELRDQCCITIHDVMHLSPESLSPDILTEVKRIYNLIILKNT